MKKARAKKVNATHQKFTVNYKSFLTLRPKLAACRIQRVLELDLDSNSDLAIYWAYG